MGWRGPLSGLLIALLLQILTKSNSADAARSDLHRKDHLNSSSLNRKNTRHGRDMQDVFMVADLRHIDGASSPWKQQQWAPAHAHAHAHAHDAASTLLRRDQARMAVLRKRMQHRQAGMAATQHIVADDDAELAAAIDPNGESKEPKNSVYHGEYGSYYVPISVGTPRHEQPFLIDSLGGLTWMRCKPCSFCINTSFNPSLSSSFKWTRCDSDYCRQSSYGTTCSSQQLCVYENDKPGTDPLMGRLAEDTFYMQSTDITDVVFGCSADMLHTPALNANQAGVLGIGNHSLSILSQLAKPVLFCLPPHINRTADQTSDPDPTGFLGFGGLEILHAPDAAVADLLTPSDSFREGYYPSLTGITVADAAVAFNLSEFYLQRSGDAGFLLDTGTAISRLYPSVYDSFQSAYRKAIATVGLINGTDPAGGFADCFDIPTPELLEGGLPEVKFTFGASGHNLTLTQENLLINVHNTTYCFAFAKSDLPVNILGTFQLSGTLVVISTDPHSPKMAFQPKMCDSYSK